MRRMPSLARSLSVFTVFVAAVAAITLPPLPVLAASPFEGAWRGSWSEPASGQGGDAALNVSESGDVSGTVVNSATRETGPIWGTISPDGRLDLRYSYDNLKTVLAAPGSAIRQGNVLTGKVAFRNPSNEIIGQGTFELTTQGTAAPPPGARTLPRFVPSAGKPEAAPLPTPPQPTSSPPQPSQPPASRPAATIFGVPVAPVIPVPPTAPAVTGSDSPGSIADPQPKDAK